MPSADDIPPLCWSVPLDDGWDDCRPRLKTFVEVLGTWPTSLPWLSEALKTLATCNADEYSRILAKAVALYVGTFVEKYHRLPIPPVRAERLQDVEAPRPSSS